MIYCLKAQRPRPTNLKRFLPLKFAESEEWSSKVLLIVASKVRGKLRPVSVRILRVSRYMSLRSATPPKRLSAVTTSSTQRILPMSSGPSISSAIIRCFDASTEASIRERMTSSESSPSMRARQIAAKVSVETLISRINLPPFRGFLEVYLSFVNGSLCRSAASL